jgi:hypothetical protein
VGTLSVDTRGYTLTVEQIAGRLISSNAEDVMAALTPPPRRTQQVDAWLLERGVVRNLYNIQGSASRFVYEINPSRKNLTCNMPRPSRRAICECPVCSRVQTLSSLTVL